MRHGDAVSAVHNDSNRQLSSMGKAQSVQSAKWLSEFISTHDLKINHSLVSPFVRAQQTHACMSEHIDTGNLLSATVFDTEEITPSGNAFVAHRNIDALLLDSPKIESVLLVSHLPLISYLLDELCTIQHSMIFATGEIACVDYDVSASSGKLIKVFTPE